MLKQFIIRHYKILFRTNLMEGLVFLLLFSSGLARYRFALVFIINGFLSAIDQYLIDNDSNAKITYYYGLLKRGVAILVLIALLFDLNNGQIFPRYPYLSFWVTFISVGLGYGFSLMLTIKAGRLVQYITSNDLFTVCPNCGYSNIAVEEICKNCSYKKDMYANILIETKNDLDKHLKKEINQNAKNSLYKKPSAAIIKGLSLSQDETILLAVKKPSIKLHTILRNGEAVTVNKFGNKCILNRIILSNKRICFLSEMFDGWRDKYCYSYDEIKGLKTENKLIYSSFLDEVDKMTIEATDAAYILRGPNPKKLYHAIAEYVKKYGQAV